jgi:5-methyltetrahydrofolate--homocysteine methyltransferase
MKLIDALQSRGTLVGDGAMGSRLFEAGLAAGVCAELWNIERPEVVEGIHRSYLEAGADFVLTNTFGGNPITLGQHGLEADTELLNRAGVAVARRAVGPGGLVLGDIGSCGKLLEPFGDLSADEARAAFARQARVLVEAGADAVICETFESSAELRAALEGAAEVAGGTPLVASMKLGREPSGRYRTMMGEGPGHLIDVAHATGCSVVGVNCGEGIEAFVDLLAELKGLTDLPLMVQPNAGAPALVDGLTVYAETPEFFAEHVPRLIAAGARIIGGCCGTTPAHIRAIRGAVGQC